MDNDSDSDEGVTNTMDKQVETFAILDEDIEYLLRSSSQPKHEKEREREKE